MNPSHPHRDSTEALQARIAQVEHERDAAKDELEALKKPKPKKAQTSEEMFSQARKQREAGWKILKWFIAALLFMIVGTGFVALIVWSRDHEEKKRELAAILRDNELREAEIQAARDAACQKACIADRDILANPRWILDGNYLICGCGEKCTTRTKDPAAAKPKE